MGFSDWIGCWTIVYYYKMSSEGFPVTFYNDRSNFAFVNFLGFSKINHYMGTFP